MNFKDFCEQNGYDSSRALNPIVGDGGSILPQKVGFQGYFGYISDTALAARTTYSR